MFYTLAMQNTVYTQTKHKLTQILPLKMNENIESNTILGVIDDEGAIHLLLNIKYKVIVEDPKPPILNTPHYTSLVLCKKMSETPNTRQRWPQITIYNKTTQRQVSKCSLYRNFVVLIPPQNILTPKGDGRFILVESN